MDDGYRKGLVLGFTMAEVMLLLLFVLMLVLGFSLTEKEEHLHLAQERVVEEVKKKEEAITELAVIREAIKPFYQGDEDFNDAWQELVKTTQANSELQKQVYDLQAKSQELSMLKNKITTASLDKEHMGADIEEQLSELLKLANKATKLEDCSIDQKEMKNLVDQNQEMKASLANKDGQLKNCVSKIQKEGHGPPPCWETPQGKAEYIYNVILKSDGLTIIDNELSHRKLEQSKLPLQGTKYNEVLSKAQFLKQTRKLYSWSVKNECRFYSKIIDATGKRDKEIYKEYRNAVEDHFYIWKVN